LSIVVEYFKELHFSVKKIDEVRLLTNRLYMNLFNKKKNYHPILGKRGKKDISLESKQLQLFKYINDKTYIIKYDNNGNFISCKFI